MDHWNKQSLGLEPGDEIVWGEVPRELQSGDGGAYTTIEPGTKGRVIAVYDGFPPSGDSETNATGVLAWAEVEFDRGQTAAVDLQMDWAKI